MGNLRITRDKYMYTYTGYTQKNGAVSMVNKGKPHHSFVYTCIYYVNINKYDMESLHHLCNVFLLFFHFRHHTYYGKKSVVLAY